MGMAVFKQPDGLYLVWDYHAVVMYDANTKAVIDYMVVKATEQARNSAADLIERADAGRPLSMNTFAEKIAIARSEYDDDDNKDADFEEWLTRMEASL